MCAPRTAPPPRWAATQGRPYAADGVADGRDRGWNEARFLAFIRGIAKPSDQRPEGCVPAGIQDPTETEAHLVINAATRLVRRAERISYAR